MEEDTEYLKLPVEDRVVHKLWKARLHGYEEVTKLFRLQDDEKSPEFSKYLGLVKKFVVDSNAVAQEKGLEAVLAFVECYALAGKTVGEVIAGIVGKCIAAPKTKTRELAVSITLMYVEAEKADIVQEELIKGMEHKNPKISSACVACMTLALKEFGSKVVSIKPLVKKISSLLEDRDKSVREEGKAMVIEMYRWVGVALKPQLANLKPVQISELEAEFEKVKNEKATPTRYLRSQQEKQAKLAEEIAATDGGDGVEVDEGDGQPEVDPYELIDPVDILSQLPKDFGERIEAKKWQERKEALDILEKLLQSPKLESGDYGDIVRALKKIIAKDANVVVVATAGKCLACLAAGLTKRFSPYASACIPAVLEKFKERKPNVVTALREAIDAIYVSTNIEAIQEDVVVALESKNPQVKVETASFLTRCFTKCTPTMLNKKVLKGYATVLLKMLIDPDPQVRDNAAEAMGTAMKVVGEKAVAPFWVDLDPAKQTKIRDCSEKAVIVAKVPAARPQTAPAKTAAAPKAGSAAAKPVKRPATSASTGPKKPAAKKPVAAAASAKPKLPVEREMSGEEIDDKASEIFSKEILTGLSDPVWKTRLTAVESFMQTIGQLEPEELNSQVLLRTLNKKPGLKDTNFQVLKVRLDAVKLICETAKVSSVAVESVLSDIAVNMGDTKNGALTAEVLTCLAEATKLDVVAVNVLDFAFTQQKSPKVQVETMTWLADAIKEFGFCVQPKALMDNVKNAVGASNAQVRNAGINLVGVIYLYMGQPLTQFFESEKPALQQLIFAEFEKRANEVAPLPIRGEGVSESSGDLSRSPSSDDVIAPAEINVQDLMPHADISELITEELVNELKDKNWKVRMEALVKVEAMVTDKLVSNNLGELPPVLCARLSDSNSKIAATAMTVCQALAMAMGSQGKVHVRSLFPSIVLGLGDSKSWIRAAATDCLNVWGQQCGFKEFFSGEMVAEALTNGSPQLRSDLWAWLEQVLTNLPSRAVPKDELLAMLPSMFAHLEDRNPDVRKNCQAAVLPIMTHLDYEPILKASERLKPGSRTVVNAVLDKVRSLLPPKPMPVKKGSALTGAGDAPLKSATSRTKTAVVAKKTSAGVAGKPVAGRKKEEDSDVSPLLQLNSLKNQRSIDENKLKVLKWNFTNPREEFVDLLKEQMSTANANKSLTANMFHADFKYHLKAIDSLHEYLDANYEATVANLDLILKWMSLRFFDTNPSVLLRGLDYLIAVFQLLEAHTYSLHEYEATSFLPYLMLKIGDPKDAVRAGVRKVILLVDQTYPHSKLFAFVMDGLKSKNARQRTECLDVLALLIQMYGLSVCSPNAATALKEIARQIADRDNSVRNAALNCIVQAWYIEGDKVYKMLGQISDKDMSLLEERIKRAEKKRPVPSAAKAKPPPVETPAAQDEPEDEEEEEEEEEDRYMQMDEVPPPAEPAPRTAVVKPRSVTGPFGLDRDLLDRIEGNGMALRAPRLTEFDFNGILDDGYLDMPNSKRAPSLSPPKMSAYQPQRLLQAAPLAYTSPQPDKNVDQAVSSVASSDLATAIMAMNHIDALLQCDMATVLSSKVDQLVLASVLQLRKIGESQRESLDMRAKAYRTLLMMLVTLYKNGGLSERVSRGSIQDLVDVLLKLLDGPVLTLMENEQSFSRVINILIVKVIEKSDHTSLTCALVKLLHNCVDSGSSPRYQELVMKCLWKVVKLLPNWDTILEYNQVLLYIHLFLKDHPSTAWKKRSSDMPVRTIKTIVHTMVKMRGAHIISELDLVDNTKESELEYYLNKLIKAVKVEDAPATKEMKEVRRLSKSTHELLSEVFRKIGSKDQTQEGLSALYDFKQSHPEADIEPFLRKSSAFFQEYIDTGLQSIEESRRSSRKNSQVTETHPPAAPPAASEDVKDAAYFAARLREMQQMAGLQATDNNTETMQLSSPESINSRNDNINRNNQLNDDKQELSSILRTSSTTTMSNLDQLRQRLDRVKGTSNRDKIS